MTDDGLTSALNRLAEDTTEQMAIDCRFDLASSVTFADTDVALQLYRIAQEAVTNAVKHAGANQIIIRLSRTGEKITLEVRDDGIGIPEAQDRSEGLVS